MGVLEDKSIKFAVRIVNLSKFLNDQKQYTIAQQIVRSGTSVGANIHESSYAETKADFVHKLHIAQKECSETIFWLKVLNDANLISEDGFKSLNIDCLELMKLLTSSIKTTKKNLEQEPNKRGKK